MQKTLLLSMAGMMVLSFHSVNARPIVTPENKDTTLVEGTQHKSRFASMRESLEQAEEMPKFPGGDKALMEWLRTHLRYPKTAAQFGVEGKVIVQFVVNEDGKVGEIKVVKSVDKELDQEAVRVCKMLPKFIPARVDGKPVKVWYTLPLTFRLPPKGEIRVE